jgi:CxxC motif-containing protein (DUF1111 family)
MLKLCSSKASQERSVSEMWNTKELSINLRRILRAAAPLLLAVPAMQAQTDPGPRGGAGAGTAIAGLTLKESKFFDAGLDAFAEVETVAEGLGPRFNLTSCGGCHAQPALGGSSPAVNPQVALAPPGQYANVSAFIVPNGPIREVRFKSDGGVHDLYTIVGMSGAPPGCNISQPPFVAHTDMIFRIPTPTFGAGLIEAISEATILANVGISKPFGIKGHENRNGNDGTVTRFGWKAQNKSLLIFSAEAYNVEQGFSNEAFPDERGEGGVPDPDICKSGVASPNNQTNFESTQPQTISGDIINFANFMRFLAAPTPSCTVGVNCSASINNGSALFTSIGCDTCHIRSMPTGNHKTTALANKTANLFSDLLVHDMGVLGDGIAQGAARGNEFRTAPLWGVGQRIFFLHDGRTKDLLLAIKAHANDGADGTSEASQVINGFNALSATQKQDLLNFLRSL